MKSFFSNDTNFKPKNKIFETIENNIFSNSSKEFSISNTSSAFPKRQKSFINTATIQDKDKKSIIGVAKRLFQDSESSYSSSFLAKTSYTETTLNSIQKDENDISKKLTIEKSSSSNSSFRMNSSSEIKRKNGDNLVHNYDESLSYDFDTQSTYKKTEKSLDNESKITEIVDLSTKSDDIEEPPKVSEEFDQAEEITALKKEIEALKDENSALSNQNEKCVQAYSKIYEHYNSIFDSFNGFKAILVENNKKNADMSKQLLSQKSVVLDLKEKNTEHIANINVLKGELQKQRDYIMMKDETIKELKEIINKFNQQSVKAFANEKNFLKKDIECITDCMAQLRIDINGKVPDILKDIVNQNNSKTTKERIKEFELLQINNNKTIKEYIEVTLSRQDPVNYEAIKSSIYETMALYDKNSSKEKNNYIKNIINNCYSDLINVIEKNCNNTILKEEIFHHLEAINICLVQKLEMIRTEFLQDKALLKNDSSQELLVKSLNSKASLLKKELLNSNAAGFLELTTQFQGFAMVISDIKERLYQSTQTSSSLNERINDLKMGQINSDILIKDKFALNETELLQFREVLMKLSDLLMENAKKDHYSQSGVNRQNSTDCMSTPQSDNNYTRELTETNEFDEIISSDEGDLLKLTKKQDDLINSSFKRSSPRRNGSLLNFDTDQKLVKKVVFNESVTVLNNGSIIKLEDHTKDVENELTLDQIDSLPDSRISSSRSKIHGLNSFFIKKSSTQEIGNISNCKNAKSQLLHKMNYEDNKFNEFEELNNSNDSLEIDNVFKTHFKGAIGKNGSKAYKRRNLRNSIKTGHVNKMPKSNSNKDTK
jgi:hypothetical protein